jgi:hypothetical protein
MMKKLTDEQTAEYFRRSYTAADGLWFMKVEEKCGFDAALEIDDNVWKVLPKIQARALKSMMHLDNGIDGLYHGITARLLLEGFKFEAQKDDVGFRIFVERCPWHDLMIKSGREHLSKKVNNLICREENSVWSSEFEGIDFEIEKQICQGSEGCVLRFHQRKHII